MTSLKKGKRRFFHPREEKVKGLNFKVALEEQVIQKFPYRCPCCDQPISYDQFDLKKGENRIQCPSCKSIFIKVVSDSVEEGKTL